MMKKQQQLEEKQYALIIEFQSYLKGKTKNKYNLNLLESGLYKVSLGKKNKNFSFTKNNIIHIAIDNTNP